MLSTKSSLLFLRMEMILTAAMISMPVMVPFYNSIGMDQGQIGLSQTMCTLALLMVNVPTGWIADRFSRKYCNAFGDLGCAISLILYSRSNSFAQVIACEVLFGFTMAFSNGADSALIKSHTSKLDKSGKLLEKICASNAIWRPIAQTIALAIGGLIGPDNARFAIAVSAVPFIIGASLSMFVRDDGEKLISQHKNPFRDMLRVIRETIIPNKKLRWLVFAYVLGGKITHVTIWALTPLMVAAGVPLRIIGIGWVLNSIAVTIGGLLAKHFASRLKKWQRFAMPSFLTIIALSILCIHLSLATIWLYFTLGLVFGWNSAVLSPMLQTEIPDRNQSTALSFAATLAQLLYAPLVWISGLAGNIDIRLSLVVVIIVFLPMITITTKKLIILKCA